MRTMITDRYQGVSITAIFGGNVYLRYQRGKREVVVAAVLTDYSGDSTKANKENHLGKATGRLENRNAHTVHPEVT